MPTQHLEQAQHNESFLTHLDSTCPEDYFDWKFTVIYYVALHYMRAYLVIKGYSNINSHEEVLNAIKPKGAAGRPTVKPHIYYGFKELRDRSNETRYEFHCFKNPKSAQQEEYVNYRVTLIEIKKYLKNTHRMAID